MQYDADQLTQEFPRLCRQRDEQTERPPAASRCWRVFFCRTCRKSGDIVRKGPGIPKKTYILTIMGKSASGRRHRPEVLGTVHIIVLTERRGRKSRRQDRACQMRHAFRKPAGTDISCRKLMANGRKNRLLSLALAAMLALSPVQMSFASDASGPGGTASAPEEETQVQDDAGRESGDGSGVIFPEDLEDDSMGGAEEGSGEDADGTEEAGETEEEDTADDAGMQEEGTDIDMEPSADITIKELPEKGGTLSAVKVEGKAAEDEAAAEQVLTDEAADMDDVGSREIKSMKKQLFRSGDGDDGPYLIDDIPRQLDGSNIESISAKWITEDTTDNEDASLLYFKPEDDEKFSVRLQINYALSGEHNYEPGDIVISVPACIIKNRDGKDCGPLIIPYAEDPSTKTDFNWKLAGDTYYLTNTRKMSAATKGYIQFAISELVPHTLVDMQESAPFDASIEVVTHRGNLIALRSNALTCQFDTEAKVTRAWKERKGSPYRVPASQIPEEKRTEGEDEYIVIEWYAYANIVSNTMYDLKIEDVIPDQYSGFILDAQEDLVSVRNEDGLYKGGKTKYYYYKTAYPASQFLPDTDYVFDNEATFTLTEEDPEVSDPVNPNVNDGEADPQLVTVESDPAQAVYRWSMPKWNQPTGHFMIEKNGNDNIPKDNYTHRSNIRSSVNDNHLWSKYSYGYYGIYPSALNDMRDGETVNISYTIDTVGYIFPWTYEPQEPVTEMSARMIGNYYRNYVKITTTDTGLSFTKKGGKLKVHEDYDFTAVEIPDTMWIYEGEPHNINPDGSFTAVHMGDGTFTYTRTDDISKYPDVILEIQRDGQWEEWARSSWQSGAQVVTRTDGGPVDGRIVPLPEGTDNIRTYVDFNMAAIDYDIRVYTDIYPTEGMQQIIESAFERSYTAKENIWNSASLHAEYSPDNQADPEKAGETIVDIENEGYDELHGYTPDTEAYPSKSSSFSDTDVDYAAKKVTIHYSAKVEERSVIQEKDIYEQAIADGKLDTEEDGVWYDLLPKGVYPVESSIKLRKKDRITDVQIIEDYKGSGRTLLIVRCDLTPSPEKYADGNVNYWMDVPSIKFDAVYDLEDMALYGNYIHNVISFESSNDTIGTIEGLQAEYGSDIGSRNAATARAFENEEEKGWMTGLHAANTNPAFLYAGTYTNLDILSAARTSLTKDVMVNGDGIWGDGLYYDDPENNKMTVYTGGTYHYRLRMMSDTDTISKDLVLYDSLENFYAGNGNDAIDIGAPRWQGKFQGIDVSQLRDMGADPVVYYSTVDNLQLSDETDPNKGNPANLDLNNTNIWVRAEDYNGSLEDVKAVAVDASKTPGQEDFVLQPEETVAVVMRMKAPEGEEASGYIAQKGIWGDSAHAYNNVYLTCTSIDANTGESDSDNFVRKDYTKIGLEEYSITVRKLWDDDNDRDGIRPDSEEFVLTRNGEPYQTKTLSAEEEAVVFENLPYTDPEGNKYQYNVTETPVEGYVSTFDKDGLVYTFTNTHEPELIDISGKKVWAGDTPSARASAVTVILYADGEKLKSMPIVGLDDEWEYSFKGLYKYKEHGTEIAYTVDEVYNDRLSSYIKSVDGTVITNTYNPYGDLQVSKAAENTTEVSENAQFTFAFDFQKDGEPVLDEFSYRIIEGEETVSEGTLTSSSDISIYAGQSIYVSGLPEGTEYTVSEEEKDGFALISSEGASGTIRPNALQSAEFVNSYHAQARNSLSVEKKLLNKTLGKYQFRFTIEDENGNILKKASNGMPGEITGREDGTVESSLARADFGAFTYTQEDHGKTYTYIIKEEDLGKDGYVYDSTVYTAEVSITDNGDGTLDVDTVYKKDGEPLENGGLPRFTNEYHAEGSLVPKCWKSLKGRQLQEGEFTFELTDENGETIQTASNKADGSVDFTALSFDETDIGKTYIYGIREQEGQDETVNYDPQLYGISVSVFDNGDGTLSITQGSVSPVYEDGALTGWEEKDAEAVVFSNTLKDGSLSISKTVENPDQADPAQEFKFRVRLIGDVEDGELEYELSQLPAEGSSDGGTGEQTGTDNGAGSGDDASGGSGENASEGQG